MTARALARERLRRRHVSKASGRSTVDRLAMLAGTRRPRIHNDAPKVSLVRPDRIDSRAKGASYENVIAKILMRWYGGIWRRTPQSGGWSHGDDGFGVGGDLVCNVPQPFHVECKNRETWFIEDLLTGTRARGTASILEWWEQSCREAAKFHKKPWLVFRRNHLPRNLVMMREEHYFWLAATWEPFVPLFRFFVEGLDHGYGPVVILTLEDLAAHFRPPQGAPNHKTWRQEQST